MRPFGIEISGNSRRNIELSEYQRAGIISMRCVGAKLQEIVEHFQCSKSTVSRTIQRWEQHQTTSALARSGRTKILSPADERKLYRTVRRTPKITYRKLQGELESLSLTSSPTPTLPPAPILPSRATIYRALRRKGLSHRGCKIKPKLTKEHVVLRRQWEREYRDFSWERHKVVFSDECSVEVGSVKDGLCQR